tara:strand:+ start:670 stop:849 length:180 start_codon:yes stop_codon:yes gene_type:complete
VDNDVFSSAAAVAIAKATIRAGYAAGFRGACDLIFLRPDLLYVYSIRAIAQFLSLRGLF